LTHGEFLDLCEGYKEREQIEWRKLAQLASWVTAPHVKKPIDPRKLLGSDKEKKKTNKTETKAVIADLMAQMGEEGRETLGNNS
jgi:hypothetical protein